jgi:hypothetical protein
VPFDVIASDNEANASFYSSLLGGKPFNVQNMTILQALQGLIKVGILRAGECPNIERSAFRHNSIQTTMNNSPLRPALENLQLDHIFDAAQNFSAPFGQAQLKERCFRLLSPLNVFPFPSSRKYLHYLDNTQTPHGVGGTPQGQNAFRDFLFIKYSENKHAKVLTDYYAQVNQPIPQYAEVKARVALLSNIHVSISPKNTHAQATKSVPNQTIRRRLLTRPPQNTQQSRSVVFEITESANGAFHLQGFGTLTGGPNRDIPVSFVVRDRNNQILKSSDPRTARDLGIAANGRVHYDADKYFSSNIVIRNPKGQIVPNNALGRRIPWR